MVRRFFLVAALAAAGIGPLHGFHPAAAQDTAVDCASALWLEPLADSAETAEAAPLVTAEAAPAWLTTELTDACSGETFTLADFAGKTLFVEAMATWCPTCHGQLTWVKEAATQIPEEERGDIVLVALSSEVDLPGETLAAYAEDNGFPFIFAVMPAEMLQAMADDLGQEIAVPPATPHLIVAADGTIGELHTGSASPEDLLALLAEAQQEADAS
jgi:thiol-disulfide isomerase/thioredoxin